MDPSWVKAFETFLNLWEVCRFPTFLGRSLAKKATDIHQFGGFPNPKMLFGGADGLGCFMVYMGFIHL